MPNQLIRMAKELLMIEGDFPYRLDYSKERPQINDFERKDKNEKIKTF